MINEYKEDIMAVNKIELSLKNVLKQAIIDLKYVEDYDVNQIVIEIPKDKAKFVI